jgi:hypothetical protein
MNFPRGGVVTVCTRLPAEVAEGWFWRCSPLHCAQLGQTLTHVGREGDPAPNVARATRIATRALMSYSWASCCHSTQPGSAALIWVGMLVQIKCTLMTATRCGLLPTPLASSLATAAASMGNPTPTSAAASVALASTAAYLPVTVLSGLSCWAKGCYLRVRDAPRLPMRLLGGPNYAHPALIRAIRCSWPVACPA